MAKTIDLKNLIEKFLKDTTVMNSDRIYNEFSLQFELGFFLREELKNKGFKVQFERNVEFFGGNKDDFVKKEIDIVVFKEDNPEKFAIELKLPPNFKKPPKPFFVKRMHHFVNDIQFMEEVQGCSITKGKLGFTKTYCLTLISNLEDGERFRTGENVASKIARYFIDPKVVKISEGKKDVDGSVPYYTENKKKHYHEINGSYPIEWKRIASTEFYYYLIEIPTDSKKDIIVGKR